MFNCIKMQGKCFPITEVHRYFWLRGIAIRLLSVNGPNKTSMWHLFILLLCMVDFRHWKSQIYSQTDTDRLCIIEDPIIWVWYFPQGAISRKIKITGSFACLVSHNSCNQNFFPPFFLKTFMWWYNQSCWLLTPLHKRRQ